MPSLPAVLTERASRLRDLFLFAMLALLPALAVGVLGLRALGGEEAAQRREVQSALVASAESVRLRIEQALAEADAALAAARIDADAKKAEQALTQLVPPFAVPVLLERDRALVVPGAPAASAPGLTSAQAARCSELAVVFARARGEPALRTRARREIMAECGEARTGDGRFLYPVVALEGPSADELDAIAAWIEQHGPLFTAGERDATHEELSAAQGLPEPARARALAALSASYAGREQVLVALRSEAAAAALRQGPDRTGMLRFRGAGAIGLLRALDDGRLAGLVVHPGSLAQALAKGLPGLAADHRAELVGGAAAPFVPHAQASISPGLELRVVPADPAAIDKRASRSRRILTAIGAGAVVVSFGLLALLWARMRAARRTSELRVDFVSAISHELRTPVSSLRMLSELLAEGRVEPAEQREIHEALAREAKRLGQTVERMLSLGRVAKGKLGAVRVDANVSAVVAEAIDAFEERCAGMPRIDRALDDQATAPIDAGQIRLAVDNLLDNARKHAPEAAPYRVAVQAEARGVSIRVEDRGPGIARRDQKRIFEPFERLDDKLSRSTEGSGLGLSLVRSVAKAHGGWVRVESEPGRGAAFVLFIAARRS